MLVQPVLVVGLHPPLVVAQVSEMVGEQVSAVVQPNVPAQTLLSTSVSVVVPVPPAIDLACSAVNVTIVRFFRDSAFIITPKDGYSGYFFTEIRFNEGPRETTNASSPRSPRLKFYDIRIGKTPTYVGGLFIFSLLSHIS